MSDNHRNDRPTDPFTEFWTEMAQRMVTGSGMSVPPTSEWAQQMRKPFFNAMSHYAEEFMRSEQFLAAMKQSMDNALAFRQQFDEFLTKNLHDLQMPSSSDADHIVLVVRGMEERLADKIDALTERVKRLEGGPDAVAAPTKSSRHGNAGSGRKRSKSR